MKTIHKFILPMKEECEIEMPYMALILRAENQDGFVCLWAIVDTAAPKVKRYFNLYKTGQEVKENPDNLFLIGRADIHVGMDLGMWVFEKLKVQ